MNSVSHQQELTPLIQALTQVLLTSAEALARSTGFVRRQRKVTGASFAQLLILGWLQTPKASLGALVQFGADLDLSISEQGLHERFQQPAVDFLKALFEVALGQLVLADPVAVPLLTRFTAVYLEDSTIVRLPDALEEVFRGCGGKKQVAGLKSSFKLQVRLDALRGGLTCSRLLDGRQTDTATPLACLPVLSRSLSIRDRGCVDLLRWQEESRQGAYVLSYVKAGVKLFSLTGTPLDLPLLLAQGPSCAEMEVLVGVKERVRMRLLFERLPPAIAQERRQHLHHEAQVHQHAYRHQADLLAGWTLVLTNVPVELLSLTEAQVLLRLRWQIELLFKVWKEQGMMDEWRTQNLERIQCEVYAKLIGLLLQHWLLIVGCWQQPLRCLTKAAKAVRSHVGHLVLALQGELSWEVALGRTLRATQTGARQNHRLDAPGTGQMLLEGKNTWSQKPRKKKSRT